MTIVENRIDTTTGNGTVLYPGDPGWDEARGGFNLLVDHRPEAIALPRNEREVAAAVALARSRGWKVAAQGTGHNAGAYAGLSGMLLVNTSRLTGVEYDLANHRVRVGAATRWGDVISPLSDRGFAALHGSSPLVGIAGYSLGGGIGWLSRKHGLQASAVTAIELVTAEGHLVRTDAVHEPELFWALRGGNGNFGVVTALEFEVQPVTRMYAGVMFFPAERSVEVLRTWTGQLPSFPEELTTWATILHVPPLPEIPEPLQGRSLVAVMGVFLGDEADGRALLEPLRALGPEIDLFGLQPPAAIADLAMDPTSPMPMCSATALLNALPDSTIDAVAGLVARPDSPILMTQFRHLGGAAGRPDPDGGARDCLPGEVVVYAVGVVPVPEAEQPLLGALTALRTMVLPHRAGEYPNFVEEPADTSRFWGQDDWTRLRRAKALYDPEDLFRGNHHIPPEA
ncbi:MAG: FAD-binding oxidoreductase [Propionicimonas sp.]